MKHAQNAQTYLEDKIPKKRTRGIICDLDGTLYKSDALQRDFVDAFINFVSIGLRISYENAEKTIEKTRLTLEKENGYPASEMWVLKNLRLDVQDWFDYSEKVINPENYLYPDLSMCETLKQARRHVWLDIATNTVHSLAKRILVCLGLEHQFDDLWTPTPKIGNNMGKPSLELYSHIASVRCLQHSKFLIVGDRWHIDLMGAELLGMKGQLVNGPEEAKEIILKYALGKTPD